MWLADLQASINGKNNRRRIPDWTWLAAKETGSLPKIAVESSVLIPAIPVICIQPNADLESQFSAFELTRNCSSTRFTTVRFCVNETSIEKIIYGMFFMRQFLLLCQSRSHCQNQRIADRVPEFYNAFDRPGRLQLLNG